MIYYKSTAVPKTTIFHTATVLCSFLSGNIRATVCMICLHCTLLAYKSCPSLLVSHR